MNESVCKKILEALDVLTFLLLFVFLIYAFASITLISLPPLVYAGVVVMWIFASAFAWFLFFLVLFKINGTI